MSDLPPGWRLQKGAGGIRAVNKARNWQTIVCCDTAKEGAGEPRAIAAAWKLEKAAERALDERERLCDDLRVCFAKEAR